VLIHKRGEIDRIAVTGMSVSVRKMREDIKEWNDCRVAVSDDALVHSEVSTFLDLGPFVIPPAQPRKKRRTITSCTIGGFDTRTSRISARHRRFRPFESDRTKCERSRRPRQSGIAMPHALQPTHSRTRIADDTIAAYDGKSRDALKALIVANEFLAAEVRQWQAAVSNGYARGKFEPCT
jgi:hypothetical protein